MRHALVTSLVLLSAVTAGAASLESEIKDRALDPAHAVSVQGIKLALAEGSLRLDKGTLVPVTKVGGNVVELAFIGGGALEYETKDAIERSQLELFNGAPSHSVRFDSAVLFIPKPQVVAALLGGKPAATLDAAATQKVNDFYTEWKDAPEQKVLHVDGILFAAASGDPFYRSYFSGFFRSPEMGNVVYQFDPTDVEQLTIGQFVPEDLDKKEERAVRKQLARQHKQGKLVGLELEDIGDWDTWTSSSRHDAAGQPVPGFAAIEPSHYEIALVIEERDLATRGTTRITAALNSPQHTVAELSMHADLAVKAVRDASGNALPFLQSRGTTFVRLPAADASGNVTLVIDHAGKLIEKGAWKMNALRSTLDWYPRAGDIDRATYDVTFTHPPGLTVLSPGDGADHRRVTTPIAGFTFEISRYKVEEFDAGPVHVSLAYDPDGRTLNRDVKKEIRDAIVASLAYFSEKFGPYPAKHLTVVTVPRDFSQSVLGFITLSTSMMEDYAQFGPIFGVEDRRTIVAHEIAHQWWGNSVGWESYRDQWLSEAMANYAAAQFGHDKLDWTDRVHIDPLSRWQSSLLDTADNGRIVESLGPIVLGQRLSSSKASNAYQSIIYKKGGIVLTMLARELGDENFSKILTAIAQLAANRVVSTERFLDLVSKAAGGVDLKPFADQFIYGTGVADVRYTYDIRKEGTGWKVRGVARQQPPLHYRHAIVQRTGGGYDVTRTILKAADVAKYAITVPVQIGVMQEGGKRDVSYRQKQIEKETGNAFFTRYFKLAGAEAAFEFDVPSEPRAFWVDRSNQALARFFDEKKGSKRSLILDAQRLEYEGRHAEAEQRYREVTSVKFDEETDLDVLVTASQKETALRGVSQYFDAASYLAIARMYLDQGKDAEVPALVQSARKAVNIVRRYGVDDETALVESRLQLRRGEYETVFKRLRKVMLGKSSTNDSAEGYAMLAVAANQMKEQDIAEEAADKARRKGVDLGPLTSLVVR
jgi:hypothetical protein